jgi:transcriptional regulator with XRE-family HTH domain
MHDTNSGGDPIPALTETDFSDIESPAYDFSSDKLALLDPEKSDQTIRRVLSAYEIGRKIRQLRLRKKVALVDLGKHTGLSASMLSQLENGKLIPTLPTLARIAMVFDVGIEHFFVERRKKRTFALTHSGERIRFPERQDMVKPAYTFECLAFGAQDKLLQAYLAEFPKRAEDEVTEHTHDGVELVHVIEGVLEIRYQNEAHQFKADDTVYFDGEEPHSYRGLSRTPARAVVITVPRRQGP